MYLPEYISNVAEFLTEISPQNSRTNPTGFMSVEVL
jgi:hypothetical protein